MSTWDDAIYLADKPKLRAAVEALSAAAPELEAIEAEAGRLFLAGVQTMQKAHDEAAAVLARYSVDNYADLPDVGKVAMDAVWAAPTAAHEAEKAAAKRKAELFQAAADAFVAAEGEDADVASAFRWIGYRGFELADFREAARDLAMKAYGRELRKAAYARPRVGIADVRVGTTLFLPHPASELRRVVKLTPTGMVDAKSLHDGGIARFRANHWPAEARRITRAMAREALAFAAEWKRRHPEPEKESVA